MPQLDALLFDLGNTLVYYDGDWDSVIAAADEALYRYLVQQQLTLDRPQFLNQFRQKMNAYHQQREVDFIEYTTEKILIEALAQFGYPEIPAALVKGALASLYAVSQAHWIPEQNVLSTFEGLKENGLRFGLVSNAGDDQDVQTLVDKASLRPYFDFIISSAKFGMRKPHPSIFEYAINHWRTPPEKIGMVGDTLNADILGANQAGLFSIWIRKRANMDQDQAGIQPDAVIDDLAQLLAITE